MNNELNTPILEFANKLFKAVQEGTVQPEQATELLEWQIQQTGFWHKNCAILDFAWREDIEKMTGELTDKQWENLDLRDASGIYDWWGDIEVFINHRINKE